MIVRLLEDNGLKCWDDKRDSKGFEHIYGALDSCKSFFIVGNCDGTMSYQIGLLEEMLKNIQRKPVFLICVNHLYGLDEVTRSPEIPIFSYEDPNYPSYDDTSLRFSDYRSFRSHIESMSEQAVLRFDKERFITYIRNTILNEIAAVVLQEPPKVFISHSSSDNDKAEEVYQKLTKHGIETWLDLESIPAGASYPDEIVRGLEWCNHLLLIHSKNVSGSDNILKELEIAHRDHKTIIPFLIDDSPISGGFRYFLTTNQWVDASKQKDEAYDKLLTALLPKKH